MYILRCNTGMYRPVDRCEARGAAIPRPAHEAWQRSRGEQRCWTSIFPGRLASGRWKLSKATWHTRGTFTAPVDQVLPVSTRRKVKPRTVRFQSPRAASPVRQSPATVMPCRSLESMVTGKPRLQIGHYTTVVSCQTDHCSKRLFDTVTAPPLTAFSSCTCPRPVRLGVLSTVRCHLRPTHA